MYPELDEETLDAMLGLSTVPEERDELKKQQKLAEMLGTSAIRYNPYLGRGRGTQAHIGGFAGALAQGIQGYGSGTLDKSNIATERDIQGRERANREKWFRARYGGGQQGGAGAAQPTAYYDMTGGQPEARLLPEEEDQQQAFEGW